MLFRPRGRAPLALASSGRRSRPEAARHESRPAQRPEAHARVIAAFSPLPAEMVSIADAAGRVLAAAPQARLTQPPADLSAMDGYAVRAEDVPAAPTTLTLVGEAAAAVRTIMR